MRKGRAAQTSAPTRARASDCPARGRAFCNPLYEACKPDIEGLLVVYASHFGIYYVVVENARKVMVLSIEDQRRNPMTRFRHPL